MTSSNQDISDCESELDSLNSSHAASTETTAQRKKVRHRFSVWSFQLTISADATALNGGRASDSVTLQEQQSFCLSTSNLAFSTPLACRALSPSSKPSTIRPYYPDCLGPI